jgi:hypothetical protein
MLMWQFKEFIVRGGGVARILIGEAAFIIAAFLLISRFLFYCDNGRLSFHSIASFLGGLLLLAKISCGIIGAWEKTDEAKNSRTTAKSSTWRQREKNASRRDGQSEPNKRKRRSKKPRRTLAARWLSGDNATDDD